MIFKGYCPAIVTPMSKGGKINYSAFKKLIDYQINNGASAIVFIGTTGEGSTLTKSEKREIISFAVGYVNKRVPVIIGAGSNSTAIAIENSKMCEELGADALLHVTPYYNKCTQSGLIEHYSQIASAVNIPIIIYNVPSRTGVNIQPQTVLKLSRIKNIVAIKEASGDIEQVGEIARICDKNFAIYSGDDALTLPILALGGSGVISVVGNILPKEMVNLCDNYFLGKVDYAREIQFKLNPLIKLMFKEVNPIPIKGAMKLVGIDCGLPRLPLTKVGSETLAQIREYLMENYGELMR